MNTLKKIIISFLYLLTVCSPTVASTSKMSASDLPNYRLYRLDKNNAVISIAKKSKQVTYKNNDFKFETSQNKNKKLSVLKFKRKNYFYTYMVSYDRKNQKSKIYLNRTKAKILAFETDNQCRISNHNLTSLLSIQSVENIVSEIKTSNLFDESTCASISKEDKETLKETFLQYLNPKLSNLQKCLNDPAKLAVLTSSPSLEKEVLSLLDNYYSFITSSNQSMPQIKCAKFNAIAAVDEANIPNQMFLNSTEINKKMSAAYYKISEEKLDFDVVFLHESIHLMGDGNKSRCTSEKMAQDITSICKSNNDNAILNTDVLSAACAPDIQQSEINYAILQGDSGAKSNALASSTINNNTLQNQNKESAQQETRALNAANATITQFHQQSEQSIETIAESANAQLISATGTRVLPTGEVVKAEVPSAIGSALGTFAQGAESVYQKVAGSVADVADRIAETGVRPAFAGANFEPLSNAEALDYKYRGLNSGSSLPNSANTNLKLTQGSSAQSGGRAPASLGSNPSQTTSDGNADEPTGAQRGPASITTTVTANSALRDSAFSDLPSSNGQRQPASTVNLSSTTGTANNAVKTKTSSVGRAESDSVLDDTAENSRKENSLNQNSNNNVQRMPASVGAQFSFVNNARFLNTISGSAYSEYKINPTARQQMGPAGFRVYNLSGGVIVQTPRSEPLKCFVDTNSALQKIDCPK